MNDDEAPALEEEAEPTAPFWMATFSDMVTLLLAFFVMLVAMSSVEVKKFEEAMSYFTGKRGMMEEEGLMPGVMGVVAEPEPEEQTSRFEELQQYVEEAGLEGKVEVDLLREGIRVTLVDEIAFTSGSAALIGEAPELLRRVAKVASHAAAVQVEGHTDTEPISSSTFPSNWELSAARAASVVRFLLDTPEAIDAEDYIAVGYGEFQPRDTNDTPEGKRRNRRIAILLRTQPLDLSPSIPSIAPLPDVDA
jgi:chemotaxis protein MotB